MSRARIALLFMASLCLTAQTASADGINTELMVPYTGIGAEFGWLGTDDADAYDLTLRGGYGQGFIGSEIFVPLGWLVPEVGDADFFVGNIGVGGRAGTDFVRESFSMGFGANFTAFIPTASEVENSVLATVRHLRPGLREVDAAPIEFGLSAELSVSIVRLLGQFGATVVIPTDTDRETFVWLVGGLSLAVDLIAGLSVVAEYTAATRTGDIDIDTHQVSFGAAFDFEVVHLGVDFRVPVGGDSQIAFGDSPAEDVPVIVGADIGFRF